VVGSVRIELVSRSLKALRQAHRFSDASLRIELSVVKEFHRVDSVSSLRN